MHGMHRHDEELDGDMLGSWTIYPKARGSVHHHHHIA